MNGEKVAPYGEWQSPVTTDLVVAGTIRLGQIAVDGKAVYWEEGWPEEGGRIGLVRWTEVGGREVVTPEPFYVRTRVHEYGGGDFTVRDGAITFANFADQRLYQQRPGSEPQPVTPKENLRFADGVFGPDHAPTPAGAPSSSGASSEKARFICVREDHRLEGQEPANAIVSLALDGDDAGKVLVSGHDFYASPRISPDGRRLAWLAWNHPNMPWDGTELWVGELTEDGSIGGRMMVAGGKNESIFQPEWSPEGVLHFVSDRGGWGHLYRLSENEIEALVPAEYLGDKLEFGRPQWLFGMRTYAFIDEDTILCRIRCEGRDMLAFLNTDQGRLTPLDLPFTFIGDIHVGGGSAYFLAGSPDTPDAIICLDLDSLVHTALRQSCELAIDARYLSWPQAIEFPTSDGQTAHAFYYPPHNEDYAPPEGELPPLIVESHGGPTSATKDVFSVAKQYWTSRGFALLDVNYGGSVGYGRAFQQRLNGQWGIVDVEDCISGARYLVEQGLVDGDRLAIHGGSAGGYTTLCALTFHDVFAAGASYFGVSDLETMAQDTHKFESRYLDGLIGPLPERLDLYRARSPLVHASQISCPLILFQGLDDPVVPPDQAELMLEAVRANGVPVAYLPFEGEQHGFRRAENIKRVMEAELCFFGRVFDFAPADNLTEVAIENLPVSE